jgi:hypothetical protein
MQMDVAPYIEDNRTFLPLRFVANALGISDSNIYYSPITHMVTLTKGSSMIQLIIGSTTMSANGATITMDVAPEIINGRTCLPIAWIAQAFDTNVAWDAATKTITLGDTPSSQQAIPSSIPAASTIVVTPGALNNMLAGMTCELTVTALMADGSTQYVTNAASYSSSDTSVATVSSTGLVACVSQGAATITVAWQQWTVSVNVTVSAPAVQPASSVVPSLQYDNIQTASEDLEWQYDGTDYTWHVEVPSDLLMGDREMSTVLNIFYHSNAREQLGVLTSASIPQDLKSIIAESSNIIYGDYTAWTTEPGNSQWVSYAANDLASSAQSAGYDYFHKAEFILSFIGSAIPYVDTTYPELPAQTLVDSGDCKDKSILYASILKSLGYKVALLSFRDVSGTIGHEAVGVAFDDSQLPQDRSSLYYFLHNGSKYYFAETTASGWTIGAASVSKPAYIYDVN